MLYNNIAKQGIPSIWLQTINFIHIQFTI